MHDGCPEPGVVRQIAWQLAASGTSVAANYEEAKGAYSAREFAAKNSIVLKDARESRMWLRLILECQLASEEEVRPLYDEANQLVEIFIATVRTLKKPCQPSAVRFSFKVLAFSFLTEAPR